MRFLKELSALWLVFFLGERLHLSNAHSWIACTDYAEKNAGTYNHDLCRGYARNAKYFAERNGEFGADKGYDHQPSEDRPCKTERDDLSSYDATHPMAVYYPGQQVVLAHPMKNHGAEVPCTNRYIPDNGNWIMRGERNTASDPPLSTFTLVADLGKTPLAGSDEETRQYPKMGYQNAPRFCDNTDRALGTYSFNVPPDLQPGLYTFLWKWAFNGLGNLYTTCFEVEIVETRAERDAILLANGFHNLYEPCGAMTSNGGVGNSNPGCTPVPGSTVTSPTTSSTTSTSSVFTTTTLPTTSTTTTQQPGGATILSVDALQMAGEIVLPPAPQGTVRRYLSVHWDCPVEANFWNVRVTGRYDVGSSRRRKKRYAGGVRYDLMQEGSHQVNSEKFYYHAMFAQPCDLQAYPPVAKLIRDEM